MTEKHRCYECSFYNFYQVNQCEPNSETCLWLRGMKEKAEKWDELCECLRWGKNTPVETILMMFNAVNTGNQLKRKKLEVVKNLLEPNLPTSYEGTRNLLYKLREILEDEG